MKIKCKYCEYETAVKDPRWKKLLLGCLGGSVLLLLPTAIVLLFVWIGITDGTRLEMRQDECSKWCVAHSNTLDQADYLRCFDRCETWSVECHQVTHKTHEQALAELDGDDNDE